MFVIQGKNSIGLMWWFLCREVLRLRGSISRELPWDIMPDLFFYRDPEEVSWRCSVCGVCMLTCAHSHSAVCVCVCVCVCVMQVEKEEQAKREAEEAQTQAQQTDQWASVAPATDADAAGQWDSGADVS